MTSWTVDRIIYVTSVDPSLPNGPGVNEREFVLALHKRFGDRMRAVVPTPARPLEDFAGVNVRYLETRRVLTRPLQFLRAEREMERVVLEEVAAAPYDLLITRQRTLPIGFQRASRRLPIPYAMRHMTGRVPEGAPQESLKDLLAVRVAAPMDRAVWRDLGARAFAIDTCTNEHLERIAGGLGVDRAKIHHKDNTVNTDRFRPGRAAEAKAKLGLERFGRIVGYAGGFASQRGGEHMFRIAPAILKRFPDTGFVIVGGGTGMEGLKDRIREAGLADAFVTPGVVPYDAVPDYMATFDVGVALDNAAREKVVGNAYQKIRQYLSTGVPVVTGSNSTFVEAGLGSFVDSSDIGQFEAAVMHWLGLDETARAALREQAHRYAVENLSSAASLERQLRFWETRMAEQQGGAGVPPVAAETAATPVAA